MEMKSLTSVWVSKTFAFWFAFCKMLYDPFFLENHSTECKKWMIEQVLLRSCYIVREQDYEFHVQLKISQPQDAGVRFHLQFLSSVGRIISGMPATWSF